MVGDFELTKIKFGMLQRIPPDELMNIDVHIDKVIDSIQVVQVGKLLGQRHFKEYNIEYPSTWWDAFKLRFFPKSKIEYTHHKISVDVIYPELHKKIQLPDEKHELILDCVKWDDSTPPDEYVI